MADIDLEQVQRQGFHAVFYALVFALVGGFPAVMAYLSAHCRWTFAEECARSQQWELASIAALVSVVVCTGLAARNGWMHAAGDIVSWRLILLAGLLAPWGVFALV